MKVLHSICQQIWKTQQWWQDWKRAVFIPIPKKGNAKKCSNYRTIVLISHTSKVMLKILQVRPQQYVNHEMFKLDLEKAEEPEIKLSASAGSSKKRVSSSSRVGDLDNTTTALMPQARVEELDGENKIPTPQRSWSLLIWTGLHSILSTSQGKTEDGWLFVTNYHE